MPLLRLSYVSDNLVPVQERRLLHEMRRITEVSKRHNTLSAVTGFLAFDESWFIQVLEGELSVVWETFERIADDPRHEKLQIIEKKVVNECLFPRRAMDTVALGVNAGALLAPFCHGGIFCPRMLTSQQIIQLLKTLARPIRSADRILSVEPAAARSSTTDKSATAEERSVARGPLP